MLQLFNYNSNPVSFRKENETVFVNATEMAKPFGKNAGHWVRNQSTQEFLTELTALRNCKGSDLVQIENGVGSWMHEDVALEFARWLNPAFAIWCNDRIKELMKYGFTASEQTLENLANNPDLLIELATALKAERAEKEKSQYQLSLANDTIQKQAPKVQYVDEVLQSVSDHTTTTIAGDLGMSAIALNKLLKDNKVQYKQDGKWKLYAKYEGKGYTKSRTHTYRDSLGNQRTEILTTWTETGRLFIHELVKSLKNNS